MQLSRNDCASIKDYIRQHRSNNYQEYLISHVQGFEEYKVERIKDFLDNDEDKGIFCITDDGTISSLGTIEYLEWDSNHFGFKVAKIDNLYSSFDYVESLPPKRELLTEIVQFAKDKGIKLLTCRVDTSDLSTVHLLEAFGFKIVDILVIFLCDVQEHISNGREGNKEIKIESFRHSHLANIKRIASQSFLNSRLYSDKNIPKPKADAFYEKLVESFVEQNGNTVLVARMGNRIAGFVVGVKDEKLSRYLSKDLGYLWLIAVAENFTGRGVGSVLIREFLDAFSRKVCLIEIGTQINNYTALRLYQRNNFKVVSSLITFHKWL